MVSARPAIASDSEGNIYLAGSAVLDVASGMTGAAVVKVNPDATRYVYVLTSTAPLPTSYRPSLSTAQVTPILRGPRLTRIFQWSERGKLGSPPADNKDTRSFVVKLDPQGSVVFSILVGGSASSTARGIAITPDGRILVERNCRIQRIPFDARSL